MFSLERRVVALGRPDKIHRFFNQNHKLLPRSVGRGVPLC